MVEPPLQAVQLNRKNKSKVPRDIIKAEGGVGEGGMFQSSSSLE